MVGLKGADKNVCGVVLCCAVVCCVLCVVVLCCVVLCCVACVCVCVYVLRKLIYGWEGKPRI